MDMTRRKLWLLLLAAIISGNTIALALTEPPPSLAPKTVPRKQAPVLPQIVIQLKPSEPDEGHYAQPVPQCTPVPADAAQQKITDDLKEAISRIRALSSDVMRLEGENTGLRKQLEDCKAPEKR
jgi:hypothetical protein